MIDRLDAYRSLALETLQTVLGRYVTEVDVREDEDHAGEPALFFTAVLDASAPLDLADRFASGQVALRHALKRHDESRFPYLQTRRPSGFDIPDDIFVGSKVADRGR